MKKLTGILANKIVLASIFFAVLFLLPIVVTNKYSLHNLIMIYFYAALSSAWNIIGGFAGQISFGHAAFFGIGAYVSTLLYLNFGVSPWIGIIAAGIVAAIVAAAISYPCFRLRGPFFTLSTIAFGEVIHLLVNYYRDITNGAVGLLIKFEPSFGNMMFRGKLPYYYIALVLLVLITLISYKITVSCMGYYLISLRENEDAAQAIGINTAKYKLYAVTLSAFLVGVLGVFYAQYLLFIEPQSVFASTMSVQFGLISIIGGLGTVAGPIVGSFIVTPLGEMLRSWLGGSFPGLHFVIYGVILIIVVLIMPHGIVAGVKNICHKLSKKVSKAAGNEVKA